MGAFQNVFGSGGSGGGATAEEILSAFKADPDFGTTGLIADAATAATELAKVPRAFAPVTAGGDFAWNKVEDTAGKLTINITPED
jgi:hypothetical protein